MKRFKVPTKPSIFELSTTKDIWFTSNNQIQDDFHFIKIDGPKEIIFGLGFSPSIKEAEENENLQKLYFALRSDHLVQDIFYFHSEKGKLSGKINSGNCWVIGDRKKQKFHILQDKDFEDLELNYEDYLVCFDSQLSAEELEKFDPELLGSKKISYPLLFKFQNYVKIKQIPARPVMLLNYSSKESHSFSIKSTLNAVPLTIDLIKNKILKYHYDKLWKIETVLHEALVNAITYGNELDYNKLVYIAYEVGYQGLRIHITDMGQGFDVGNISVPVGSEALEKVSGRGIYIIKKFSDAFFFNEAGNQNVLFFEF